MQSLFLVRAEVFGATIVAATTLELGRGVVMRLDPDKASEADVVVRVTG